MKASKNESGQTLLIIFLLMVISLTIGIAVSNRFIKGARNITQTDQASMAVAVAEAAIEHILLLPVTTLESYADNGNCTTDCYLEITDANNNALIANVALTRLGNSSEPFIMDLALDDSAQVNLATYPGGADINICWNSGVMSVSAIYIYGTLGDYEADSYSYNPIGSSNSGNGFETATANFGYANCFVIVAEENSVMLRIKPYYEENIALIVPPSGVTLPQQGILIESTGTVGSTVKKVSVIIADPKLSTYFDYSLYQKSPSAPLSN